MGRIDKSDLDAFHSVCTVHDLTYSITFDQNEFVIEVVSHAGWKIVEKCDSLSQCLRNTFRTISMTYQTAQPPA